MRQIGHLAGEGTLLMEQRGAAQARYDLGIYDDGYRQVFAEGSISCSSLQMFDSHEGTATLLLDSGRGMSVRVKAHRSGQWHCRSKGRVPGY